MKPNHVTPDAGRNRPVSLDQLGDLPDPGPWPGEFEEAELSRRDLTFADGAHAALLAVAEVLPAPERESLLAVIQPDEMSLRARARVASVPPNSIRNRALRYRAALAEALHISNAGIPLEQNDSGDNGGFR